MTDNLFRDCKNNNPSECKGFFLNNQPDTKYKTYLMWWDIETLYHGYWAQLNNLYRYNISQVPSDVSKEETFVYFSSIAIGIDLGYYFTRWGLTLTNGTEIFNENKTSVKYKNLMKNAISNGLIVRNSPKKKFWYLDDKEYNYITVNYRYCYKNGNEYDVQIVRVTEVNEGYKIILPQIDCPGYFGFEIYCNDALIDFTYEYSYIYTTQKYVNPKFNIIAYDRYLYASKPSEYVSPKSNLKKIINFKS